MHMLQFGFDELVYLANKAAYLARASIKNTPRRIILVNGGPRTGTTWTVSLFASIPGYHRAGNFQRNIARYRKTNPGDVVHGHDHYTEDFHTIAREKDIRVVLLMRDLRDQTVSRLFHIRRNLEHPWQAHLQGLSDDEGLMACIEGLDEKTFPGAAGLASIPKSWLDNYPHAHLVKYEDLNADPAGTMRRLCRDIEVDIPEGLLRAVVRQNRFEKMTVGRKFWKPGRKPGETKKDAHVRKGIVGDWQNHFKPEHVQRFKEAAGDILIEFGYEKDLDW